MPFTGLYGYAIMDIERCDKMRIFIGISLSQEEKSYLKKTQDALKSSITKGTLTHFDNFHITLKYIGNATNNEVDDVMNILDEVASNTMSFSIKIGDFGIFKRKNNSIMWVGITKGKTHLSRLYHKIETACVNNGFEPEGRKYKPHITLGKKIEFSNGHQMVDIPYYPYDVNVSKITLFESNRVDGVLTYTPIYNVNLN